MKTLIKILLVLSVLTLSLTTFSQAPEGINYQATVRNSSGALMTNQSVTVVFAINQTSATGTTVYQESHSVTTNSYGGFNAVIGAGTASTGTFSSINWGTNSHYLNVKVNGNDLGTTQLMSVPYALYAKTSGSSTAGPSGKTILNGTTIPTSSTGTIGDFYINTLTLELFGPKTSSGWGVGVSLKGPKGDTGAIGPQGQQGPIGITGAQGIQGIQGVAGPKGDTGATGPQGPIGLQGLKGDQGIQGIAGPKGDSGAMGPQGIAGPQGPMGPQGNPATDDQSIDSLTLNGDTLTVYIENGNSASVVLSPHTKHDIFEVHNDMIRPKSGLDSLSLLVGSTQINNDGDPAHYVRLFFDKETGAFRVGKDSAGRWDQNQLGDHSFATGFHTLASGDYSTSLGRATNAIGRGTLATGIATHAKGDFSTAHGSNSRANGYSSMAIGRYAFANGDYSFATGHFVKSHADNSFSAGERLNANGYSSTVIGMYNDTLVSIQSFADSTTPLFIIGNGDNKALSNAFTVFQDGRVKINQTYTLPTSDGDSNQVMTTDGAGNLSWQNAGSGSVVFENNNGNIRQTGGYDTSNFIVGSPQINNDFNPDHKNRMFYDKESGAFRAGSASMEGWDQDSLGQSSFATGANTKATGTYSTATGVFNQARGEASTAMGSFTQANGNGSTAVGESTTANGKNSVATGSYTSSNGKSSLSTGVASQANGDYSTAHGNNSRSNGSSSMATGRYATAKGSNSLASGSFSTANANNTMTAGERITANGYASTVIGMYNDTLVAIQNSADSTTPLLIVGNGENGAPSNAMTVFKDGRVKINQEYTMPTTDGSSNQVMTTDGAGNLSWQNAGSGSGVFENNNGDIRQTGGYDTVNFVIGSPHINYDGNINHYNKMFFDKESGSFRVGTIDNENWDKDSLGRNSFASGTNVYAKGDNSVAFGARNVAEGDNSYVNGIYSYAKGDFSEAKGFASSSLGDYSEASGAFAVAKGYNSKASGEGTSANGDYSIASGYNTQANGYISTVIGSYNDTLVGVQSALDSTTPLFIIGNGEYGDLSNAFTVFKDGRVKINQTYTLPTTDGTNNQVMTTDGAGNLSWENAGTGSGVFENNNGVVQNSGNYNSDDFVFGDTVLDYYGFVAASKRKMFFDKSKGAFRVGSQMAQVWDETSLGTNSLASGVATLASGNNSVAFGAESITTGNNSISSGLRTKARGENSTAFGRSTEAQGNGTFASGEYSIAQGVISSTFGKRNIANGYSSTVVGIYNDSLIAVQTSVDSTTPLFIVGNGEYGVLSNAFTVFKDGRVKINQTYTLPTTDGTSNQVMTTDGAGNLSWASSAFENIGGVIRNKGYNPTEDFLFGSRSMFYDGFSNNSYKMFYDRSKGAFRVGRVTSENWDQDSLGNYSFAGGDNTKAKGNNSTAFGKNTQAIGNYSTSLGYYTVAVGSNSTALGSYNESNSNHLFSIGNGFNHLTRRNALHIFSTSNNMYTAGNLYPMVSGTKSLGTSTLKWSAVYATNGTIQTSDTTLKTNIAPLSYGLEELMKIKTISYNWKDDERQVKKIGFNAQNLLKIVPEVVQTHSEVTNEETGEVTYEENETLGVFYSDMIPVLTKSIQEQQEIIKKQEAENEEQKAENKKQTEELEKM
ncbi:MAG: tail fiber domain-containing protein, partial [Flavobacteriales bacterium]